MSKLIVVLTKIPELSCHVQKYLPQAKVVNINTDSSDYFTTLESAKIILGDCDLLSQNVQYISKAKWVQSTWAGVDAALNAFRQNNASFIFTRYSDKLFGRAMSEYVVAQIYNHERGQRQQYVNQSQSTWSESGKIKDHRLIQDLTIGILGLGNIGMQIASILKTLGAQMWGLKRTVPEEKSKVIDKYLVMKDLPELLGNCDYVINVLPSTRDSIGLLNGDRLKGCEKKQSVFLNIGRGSIIKETDLVNALKQKWISAAILDVFENEPLPSESELWLMPQVTISPHISGVSRSQDVAKFFAENYTRYISGEQPLNIVNFEQGY